MLSAKLRKSCQPNAIIQHVITKNREDEDILRLFVVAKEKIEEFTEITIPLDLEYRGNEIAELDCACRTTDFAAKVIILYNQVKYRIFRLRVLRQDVPLRNTSKKRRMKSYKLRKRRQSRRKSLLNESHLRRNYKLQQEDEQLVVNSNLKQLLPKNRI